MKYTLLAVILLIATQTTAQKTFSVTSGWYTYRIDSVNKWLYKVTRTTPSIVSFNLNGTHTTTKGKEEVRYCNKYKLSEELAWYDYYNKPIILHPSTPDVTSGDDRWSVQYKLKFQ